MPGPTYEGLGLPAHITPPVTRRAESFEEKRKETPEERAARIRQSPLYQELRANRTAKATGTAAPVSEETRRIESPLPTFENLRETEEEKRPQLRPQRRPARTETDERRDEQGLGLPAHVTRQPMPSARLPEATRGAPGRAAPSAGPTWEDVPGFTGATDLLGRGVQAVGDVGGAVPGVKGAFDVGMQGLDLLNQGLERAWEPVASRATDFMVETSGAETPEEKQRAREFFNVQALNPLPWAGPAEVGLAARGIRGAATAGKAATLSRLPKSAAQLAQEAAATEAKIAPYTGRGATLGRKAFEEAATQREGTRQFAQEARSQQALDELLMAERRKPISRRPRLEDMPDAELETQLSRARAATEGGVVPKGARVAATQERDVLRRLAAQKQDEAKRIAATTRTEDVKAFGRVEQEIGKATKQAEGEVAKTAGARATQWAERIAAERERAKGAATTIAKGPAPQAPVGFVPMLKAYEDTVDRIGVLEERLLEAAARVDFDRIETEFVRPPKSGSWTSSSRAKGGSPFVGWSDQDILEFAEMEGLNPYKSEWWEQIDPQHLKDYRNTYKRGASERNTKQRAHADDLRDLEREWKQETKLRDDLTAKMSAILEPEAAVPVAQAARAPEELALAGQTARVKPKMTQEPMFSAKEPGIRPEFPTEAKTGEAVTSKELLGGEQFESETARSQFEREQQLARGQGEMFGEAGVTKQAPPVAQTGAEQVAAPLAAPGKRVRPYSEAVADRGPNRPNTIARKAAAPTAAADAQSELTAGQAQILYQDRNAGQGWYRVFEIAGPGETVPPTWKVVDAKTAGVYSQWLEKKPNAPGKAAQQARDWWRLAKNPDAALAKAQAGRAEREAAAKTRQSYEARIASERGSGAFGITDQQISELKQGDRIRVAGEDKPFTVTEIDGGQVFATDIPGQAGGYVAAADIQLLGRGAAKPQPELAPTIKGPLGAAKTGPGAANPVLSGPSNSADLPTRVLGEMYEGKYKPKETKPGILQRVQNVLGEMDKAFFNSGHDIEAMQAAGEKAAKAQGRRLRPDEMLASLVRVAPDPAATQRVSEALKPVLTKLSPEDQAWLNTYLTYQDNVDVATAMGAKVEKAALAKGVGHTAAASRVREEEARLRLLQRHQATAAKAGNVQKSGELSGKIARTQKRIATWQGKLADEKIKLSRKGYEAGQEAEGMRKFSAGLNAKDSRQSLVNMAVELGPERMKQIEDAAQAIWKLGKDYLKRKEEAGIITPEVREWLDKTYPHYSRTVITDYLREETAIASGKRLGISDPGLRRNTIEGTEKFREHPINSAIRNAFESERLIARNNSFNALDALRNDVPEYQTIIRELKQGESVLAGEEAITGFRKGEKVRFAVPKSLGEIAGPKSSSIPTVFKPYTFGVGIFRALATVRNVGFLVTQGTLDPFNYFIRESSRYGLQAVPELAWELGKGYGDAFKGILSGEYKGRTASLMKQGGGYSGYYTGGLEETKNMARELSRANAFEIKGSDDLRRLLKDVLTAEPVAAVGQRLELGPRVAAQQMARKRGVSDLEAMIRGRDLIDFNRAGTFTRVLNQFIPFFNVGFQGVAAPFRAFRENPAGTVASIAALVSAPVVAAEIWNRADPQRAKDYEDVPDYVKNSNIVVMLPAEAPVDAEGNRKPLYVYIPLREWAAPANITRQVFKRFIGEKTDSLGGLIKDTGMALSPVQGADVGGVLGNALPYGISTGIELAADYDFYRGQSIATKRRDESANAISKGIAGALNVRPSQVDYALRDMGASGTQAAFGAADILTRKQGQYATPGEVPVAGAILGRVVRNTGGQRLEDAQQNIITEDSKRKLKEAGVERGFSPSGNTVSPRDGYQLKLTRQEQEQYQVMVNEELNKAISAWQTAKGEKALDTAVGNAREKARERLFNRIGAGEVKRRQVKQ